MSSINRKISQFTSVNSVGTAVPAVSPEQQLKRLTLASMLWEDQFYLDGVSHSELLKDLVKRVSPEKVANLAKVARSHFKLRHIPLFLLRELARSSKLSSSVLTEVIQRPDEMAEFVSIYWKDGKIPLSNQVKKGLAACFNKFSEYQLAKWDKNNAAVSIRDVMFLTHPKPQNTEQERLFQKIASKSLETPDTWETQLSAGADKGETFTRLMQQNKLGALAFLRNLRNMTNSGVSENLIRTYGLNLDVSKVLPFRFIAAARIVPHLEDLLETMMLKALRLPDTKKLNGKTVLLVDVSGSMFGTKISNKSDLERFDAAAALAILCREICESVEIYSFSNNPVRVAPRTGFALAEAIRDSQYHCGTWLGSSLNELHRSTTYDRIIVFTDEQSYDTVPNPQGIGYIINVAGYQNGVNHGSWSQITGFSEAVVDYIQAIEESTS